MIGARVGQLVVKRKLGEGGMGAVYCAEHEILHTRRVIKVLLPQWTQSEVLVKRFINEARAAASIRHRNIIAVHDCGQLPDGTWYIAMDYLDGATLARFGESHGGPMSPHLAVQILAPIANGLEAAHRAGIVHRDLKPDNIFLIQHEHARNPHHPVILDFGIAKLGEHEGGAITRTGMVAGTPSYMAPEQMRDLKLVDARSDVYALGVIAYQVVTGGYLPYQDQATLDEYSQLSAAEIYHRQMSRPPIDPRERFAGISEGWASAILAAIEPDPARRMPSPRAFVLKLAEATQGDGFTASGTEIVRAYASELLEIGDLLETVRAPKPAVKAPRRAPAPGTTLGNAASQSVGGSRRGARGLWLAAVGLVLLGAAAGAIASAVATRDRDRGSLPAIQAGLPAAPPAASTPPPAPPVDATIASGPSDAAPATVSIPKPPPAPRRSPPPKPARAEGPKLSPNDEPDDILGARN